MIKYLKLPSLLLIVVFSFCGSPHHVEEYATDEPTGKNTAVSQDIEHKYLISAVALLQKINNNEEPIIIDVRRTNGYKQGHIPGALNVWRPMYVNEELEYRGMIAPKEKVQALMSNLGVSAGQNVIIYDASGYDASRFWWTLKRYGHTNTMILDGGLTNWVKKGYPVSNEVPSISPTEFSFNGEGSYEMYADLEDVKAAIDDPDIILLDVRSDDEFNGGHIPSSIHLEWINSVNIDSDKKLKSLEELKEIFISKGITADKKIITYCHTGVRAAQSAFVLKELLGFEEVKNYDGSWSEWTHFKMPVESKSTNR